MKIIVSEINHYWVHFQAGRTGSNLIYPKIIVKCYHDEDYVLQASFYPDGKSLPENYHYLSRIDSLAQQQNDTGINTESTRVKLVTVYKRMLNEAGIIFNDKPVPVFVTDSFWCPFIQQNDPWFVEACFLTLDQLKSIKENCR